MPVLDRVDSWLYHLGDVNRRRANEIADTDADMVITEWASYAEGEAPYTAAHLERMRGDDADRLIVSYLSIGEAETYRYYWDDAWEGDPPAWLDEPNGEWPDNINVRYWDEDWQAVIFDYVDRIVDAGFNGLYLDLVQAYEHWEDEEPDSGVRYPREMANFLADIRAHAEERLAEIDPDREFVMIGQNGLELLRNDTYANAVDGIAREDLRFYYRNGNPDGFPEWPDSEYDYHLDLLRMAEQNGISAFVVEYVPGTQTGAAEEGLTAEADDLAREGIPLYVADNRDLDTIAEQPDYLDVGTPVNVITGTKSGERIAGTDGDDAINARGGSDEVRAGDGVDVVRGSKGNDQLYGEGDADTLFGNGGFDELFGGAGGDALFGGGKSDFLSGGQGRDRLVGGAGSDELFGGAGNDVLIGGSGGDTMEGGAGADVFLFGTGSQEDEITDFDPTEDRIILQDGLTYSVYTSGNDTYIAFSADDGVLLFGVESADITDDVFG